MEALASLGSLQFIIRSVRKLDQVARVLFLHHNFPAQFRFLALHLASQDHDVVFLSEKNTVGDLPGIRQISISDAPDPMVHSNLDGQLACSARFREGMFALKGEGWILTWF